MPILCVFLQYQIPSHESTVAPAHSSASVYSCLWWSPASVYSTLPTNFTGEECVDISNVCLVSNIDCSREVGTRNSATNQQENPVLQQRTLRIIFQLAGKIIVIAVILVAKLAIFISVAIEI